MLILSDKTSTARKSVGCILTIIILASVFAAPSGWAQTLETAYRQSASPSRVLRAVSLPSALHLEDGLLFGLPDAHTPSTPFWERSTYALPTPDERWRAFRREVVSPAFLFQSVGAGAAAHIGDAPDAWRGDATGFAARVGSNAGGALLQITSVHGLAAAMRLDIRFAPMPTSAPTGVRLRRALLSTVTARTGSGAWVPNAPNIIGSYGATLAQRRWERGDWDPERPLLGLAISLGFDTVVNVMREFVIRQ